MAFTEVELAYLRERLGSTVDETTNPDVVTDLEDRYARLGTVPLVVVEVLRQRLADIADIQNNPLNFTIPGDYSQDASDNVALLEAALGRAEQEAGVPGASVLVGVQPSINRWRPDPCEYRPR